MSDFAHILAPCQDKCWFQEKLFFINIKNDNCLDYKDTMRILKLHYARVASFLSKDVTHVIRIEKPVINNKNGVSKQRYGRAEKIVQLALKSQLLKSRESTLEHYKILTTNDVIKQSLQCDISFNHK